MAEAGLANYVSGNWYGVLAPAGTQPALAQSLNRQINAVLARADVKDMLIAQGFEPAGCSNEEFARFIKSEIASYAALVKAAGLKP